MTGTFVIQFEYYFQKKESLLRNCSFYVGVHHTCRVWLKDSHRGHVSSCLFTNNNPHTHTHTHTQN